jgi:succinoglycan biosynthesis protein ExoO
MSVSVIIPAYNVEECIERAIRSALEQSLEPLEVIVVDDGSTDTTADLVSRLSTEDGRIKLLRQPTNAGPAAARNLGIGSATGKWIAILDADDAFLPDRLRTLVGAAESRKLTFAADNLTLYDMGARRNVRLGIEPARIGSCLALDRYSFVRNCMMNKPGAIDFGLLMPVMRRSFLSAAGVSYPEDCRHGEDFIFYLRALIAGATFEVFPGSMYLYSQRTGSISQKRSNLSRTMVNYRLMEEQTRALVAEPAIGSDPLLASLLAARADRIRALRVRREAHEQFRDTLRQKDYVAFAAQFLRNDELRRFVFRAIARGLRKRLMYREFGSQ